MASDWLLQTIYAALIGQAIVPSDLPPTNPTTTNNNNVLPNRPLVHTSYGDVLGIQKLSSSGSVINTFLGIPFASPPVGNLRFDKPMPASRWNRVKDASEFGSDCMQDIYSAYYSQLFDNPKAEDCLYLNIYKPEMKTGSNVLLPVMVWVHGGGFVFGASSQYDATDLAANGVIVVTINHRLEVFGYLSNDDDVIPGNYGMLDQVMALKWVRENIRSFGGDPDKVTIFGESAGSASVSMLVLSPLAKGLFSRAIMESGTSLSPWGFQFPAARVTPSQMTNLVGASVGCNEKTSQEKLNCIRQVDAGTLLNGSVAVGKALGLPLLWKPVVETKFGFLPDRPVNLWTQGKFNHVDTIRGFNKAESGQDVLFRSNYSLSVQQFIAGVKGSLVQFAIVDLDEMIKSILQDNNVNFASDGHDNFMKLVEVLSDINFRGGTIVEGNLEFKMAPEMKHYIYEFDYRPSRSKTPTWMPAVHGQELEFVFGTRLLDDYYKSAKPPSTNDELVSKVVQKLWINFAKYGTPTQIPSLTGNAMSSSATFNWGPYIGDGTANVLRIGLTSKEVSFRNHSSARTFQTVFKRVDSVLPERFIVG